MSERITRSLNGTPPNINPEAASAYWNVKLGIEVWDGRVLTGMTPAKYRPLVEKALVNE
jgi:hypothetical protein